LSNVEPTLRAASGYLPNRELCRLSRSETLERGSPYLMAPDKKRPPSVREPMAAVKGSLGTVPALSQPALLPQPGMRCARSSLPAALLAVHDEAEVVARQASLQLRSVGAFLQQG
jgi:hypothetical protein